MAARWIGGLLLNRQQSLGADEAAPSNSFESKPGGTRFVVSQTSDYASAGAKRTRARLSSRAQARDFAQGHRPHKVACPNITAREVPQSEPDWHDCSIPS